jgi:poly(A) polymerase Pap1
MRTGQFVESLETIDRTIDMAVQIEKDFGPDMDIVLAKFSMQKANVAFLLGNYELARTFADKCISSVNRVDVDDAQIMKQMQNTKRDAKNCSIRAQAKLTGQPASQIREGASNFDSRLLQ